MYERSVSYNCLDPFHGEPDLWWPAYVEGVCWLPDEPLSGKLVFDVSEWGAPEPAWIADLPAPLSIGSHIVPRHDTPAACVFCAPPSGGWTSVTRVPEPAPDVPPIPLPAGGLLMLTAIMALALYRRLS